MFEVGKKYRYTGKGDTNFNSKGLMDYLKEGEHEVKSVEFNLGVFSDKPYVRFSDDPSQNGWFVDPTDFEEVSDTLVFSAHKYFFEEHTGNPREFLKDHEWVLEWDGTPMSRLGFISPSWCVPEEEFEPYVLHTFEVGKYYQYNGQEHFRNTNIVAKNGVHKVADVRDDGTYVPFTKFEDMDTYHYLDIRDFDVVDEHKAEITVILNGCTEPKYFTSIQQLVKWAVNIL